MAIAAIMLPVLLFAGVFDLGTDWYASFTSSAPQARSVPVRIDPTLSTEGAWQLGSNALPPDTRYSSIEVEATTLADGNIRVIVRHAWGGVYGAVLDLWLDLSRSNSASARVSARTFESPSGITWHYYGLGGTVTASSDTAVLDANANVATTPLVIAYNLEGQISGSPGTIEGKVALSQKAR